MRRTDPSRLNGDDLKRWYRRPVGQVETERERDRQSDREAYFAEIARSPSTMVNGSSADDITASDPIAPWREARLTVRPAPPLAPPLAAPGGARIAAPLPAALAPDNVPKGGFFDTHAPVPNPALGPAYFTDLPSPLNLVTPKVGGWFELGDGSLVRGVDEVERLHAEQQKRMRGEDDFQPPKHVHAADRIRDGVIPQVSQIAKGQREIDATCHPYGGWERDPGFDSNSERSRRYESQIGRAPGLDYVVRNPGESPVDFDGCAVWDPRRQLLEAKGFGYQNLFRAAEYSPKIRTPESARDQVRRQSAAARGRSVEWHIAEPGAVPYFAAIASPYPSLRVVHTPAR